MKSGISKTRLVIAAMVILVALPFLTRFYVQSGNFRVTLSELLSSTVGEDIEIDDDLAVHSIFPTIKVSVAGARLIAKDDSAIPRRIRIKNIDLSISALAWITRGSKGELEFSADSISVIHQSGKTAAAQPADNKTNENRADTIADHLARLVNRHSGIQVSANIGELDVHWRDADGVNTTWLISRLSLAGKGTGFSGNALLLAPSREQQQLGLQIQIGEPSDDLHAAAVSGTLDLQLAPENQQGKQQLLANWVVDENRIQLEKLEYTSENIWLRGKVTVDNDVLATQVDADLELRRFEFNADEILSGKSSHPSLSDRLFSYDLFGADLPKHIDADVVLHLGAVRMDGAPVVNGLLRLAMSDGKVAIESEDLYLLGGESNLSLSVDNSLSQLVGVKLKFEADDMQLERIRSLDKKDTVLSQGSADVIVALRGAGPSPGHVASSMNGYAIATVSRAEIKQKYATAIDTGVVSWAFDKLSLVAGRNSDRPPRARLSDPLSIECASLRLYVNDGKLEVSNGAIVEFPDNVLFSSGYVDLESETLGFAFRTKSRSLFDWSAISIARFAEVGGTLLRPTVSLNERELVKQGVLSASSAAWGPLPSLVYSLAEAGVRQMQTSRCEPDI